MSGSAQQFKVFVFNSPRECRWEVYWGGTLIRSMRAKNPEEARAVAEQYLESLQQSSNEVR
jgi:hypothetical protein